MRAYQSFGGMDIGTGKWHLQVGFLFALQGGGVERNTSELGCNGSSNTLWINQDLLRLYTFKMAPFMWYQLCLSQENPNQTEFLLKKKKQHT